MFSNQRSEVTVESGCRVVEAVQGDRVDNRWLLGGGNSHHASGADHHVCVVRYHSEVNEIGVDALLHHDTGPVQCMVSSPQDATKFITAATHSSTATLWQAPTEVMHDTRGLRYDPELDGMEDHSGGDPSEALATAPVQSLETLTTLPSMTGEPVVDVVWRNSLLMDHEDTTTSNGDVLTLDRSGSITQWDVAKELAQAVRTVDATHSHRPSLRPRVAWDPHSPAVVAVTRGPAVHLLDWRQDGTGSSLPLGIVESIAAHRSAGAVLDIDFNPNQPYVLSTAGPDGLIKFWDLRRTSRHPLLTCRGGHTGAAWTARYNPFHDQLVLSTGSDARCNLWRVSSISSAPLVMGLDEAEGGGGGSGEGANKASANCHIDRYDHGHACYAASWGTADAWIYLSVGYEDGKAVLHHVPSDEKYKILL